MNNQLSLKTKAIYLLYNTGTSALKSVTEILQDYNRTNVVGNLKSLARKGFISCSDKKLSDNSKLSLTEKGINFITKKTMYIETV